MTGVILLRVLLSVGASAIQKRLLMSGMATIQFWMGAYALMLLPALLIAVATWQAPASGFWTAALLAGLLDALGNLAMLAALRTADLSVFGPLNAIRPLLALLFGWIFLSELPSATGALGVAITVGGAYFLLREPENLPGENTGPTGSRKVSSMLAFRLLGFVLSTIASVFLKRSANLASAEATLAVWIVSGLATLLLYRAMTRSDASNPQFEIDNRQFLILHAATFLLMQWLTIRVFQATLLAYSFALFQLGMVLQVMAGRFIFREPHFRRRIAACLIMTAGSLLILWKG